MGEEEGACIFSAQMNYGLFLESGLTKESTLQTRRYHLLLNAEQQENNHTTSCIIKIRTNNASIFITLQLEKKKIPIEY